MKDTGNWFQQHWRQTVAVLVGAAVLVAGGCQLRGGLTVGGQPLSGLEPAVPTGLSRLMTDQMAVLLTVATVVGLAYLAATIARAALDDRWLRRLGPTGGELDPKDARLDEMQSEELRGLALAVGMMSQQVGEHATTLDQLKEADDGLIDAIEQVSRLVEDLGNGNDHKYSGSPDEEDER